jgi:ATP-dependent helicase STH1/SNF2
LGKTIQTIALLCHLFETHGMTGPHLIVAPKSTLPNWAREFAQWAPGLRVVTYEGSPDERAELWQTKLRPGAFHVLLTNYEKLMSEGRVGGREAEQKKLSLVRWQYLVLDEGHRLKNSASKGALTLAALYKHVRHRLILSGTPLQNSQWPHTRLKSGGSRRVLVLIAAA